jgi:hypothetical protein
MNIDSALVGVIIGSLLSLASNFVVQLLSIKKEERQWERQQRAEDKKRTLDEERQRIEKTRQIYHNCISRLSLIESSKSDMSELSNEKLQVLNQETIEWLSLLSLHQRDLYEENRHSLHTLFRDFVSQPKAFAGIVLQEVYKLAMSDKVLFPNVAFKTRDPNRKRVQLNIPQNFRREQIVSGIELKPSYMVEVDISKLKPSQREKLWDQNNNQIPDAIHLRLPQFNERTKQIELRGQVSWEASINPNETSIEEIFDRWEQDYDEEIKLAQEKLTVRQA